MSTNQQPTGGVLTLSTMALLFSLGLTLFPAYTVPALFVFAGTVYFFIRRDDQRKPLRAN